MVCSKTQQIQRSLFYTVFYPFAAHLSACCSDFYIKQKSTRHMWRTCVHRRANYSVQPHCLVCPESRRSEGWSVSDVPLKSWNETVRFGSFWFILVALEIPVVVLNTKCIFYHLNISDFCKSSLWPSSLFPHFHSSLFSFQFDLSCDRIWGNIANSWQTLTSVTAWMEAWGQRCAPDFISTSWVSPSL